MRCWCSTSLSDFSSIRLDWQMWFAALGTPQRNAWLLNLIVKLLDDCSVVQHLVGDPKLLSGRNLVKIRAKLYHYDFTRLNTLWNRGIPGAVLTNTSSIFLRPQQYWYRQYFRSYLGELDRESILSIKKQLVSHGYTDVCKYVTDHHCDKSRNAWCYSVLFIRQNSLHLVPVCVLIAALFYRAVKVIGGRRRRDMTKKPSISKEKKNQ